LNIYVRYVPHYPDTTKKPLASETIIIFLKKLLNSSPKY
jgi:hypothetical protein